MKITNKIFLWLLAAIMSAPMISFRSKKSYKLKSDNRMAAVMTKIRPRGEDGRRHWNKNWAKDFEKYFNDRIGGRNLLIKLDVMAKQSLSEHFGYGRDMMHRDNFAGAKNPAPQADDNAIGMYVEKLNDFYKWCGHKKIKCYFVALAEKDILYGQHYLYRYPAGFRTEAAEILERGADIIYPIDALFKAKVKDFVYFKGDHHYTDWGAFVEYGAIMERIRKDFPNAMPVPESDFNFYHTCLSRHEYSRGYENWGETYKAMKLGGRRSCNQEYRHFDHRDIKNLYIEDLPAQQRRFRYAKGAPLRVVVWGSSHTENITSNFFAYTFRDVLKLRSNLDDSKKDYSIERYGEKIDEFKPDIIIIIDRAKRIELFNFPKG